MGARTSTNKKSRFQELFSPLQNVGKMEALLMRFLFAFVIPQILPAGLERTSMPKPNGFAWWIDFTWLAAPGMEGAIKALFVVLLVFYVLGARLSLVTPLLLVLTIAIRTLENSAGSIHHGYQVISMVLAAQSVVYLWQNGLKEKLGVTWQAPFQRSQEAWALWASQMAIVALYLVSVASKIENSDGMWLWNSPGFATEVVKTYRQNYYSYLDATWGVPPEEFPKWASWIAKHPILARFMFGAGFFMEAIAFLALLRWRWIGALVGLGLIGMHTSIDLVMGLAFPQNIQCLWIFFVGVPFFLTLPCKLACLLRKKKVA